MASPNKNNSKLYQSIKNNYNRFTHTQIQLENKILSKYKNLYDFLQLIKLKHIPVKHKITIFFTSNFFKLKALVIKLIKYIQNICFHIFK